jgi:hypothetical protein
MLGMGTGNSHPIQAHKVANSADFKHSFQFELAMTHKKD